jgi:2-iminoacetate synthase
MKITDIINETALQGILESVKKPEPSRLEEILVKAREMRGIEIEEAAELMTLENSEDWEKVFETSAFIKKTIYGERLVFFAPLYISSYCVNDCKYCGFHCSNPTPRKRLSLEEVAQQTRVLADMGHKRLLLEFGEHPELNDIDYVTEVIRTIYATKSGNGEIRRVNVNIAATTADDYRKLKEAGIGTYQLFQETYHRETYEALHKGPKADYERQLFVHDRAFEGGIDDVGLGVLFGLYDYRFEVLALISHAQYLDQKYGVGPHTLSVPRFQPADTVNLKLPHQVDEETLLKIIAVLRIAVPYTGMIISTRERPEIRKRAFELGISQTSAASRTSPGGYGTEENLSQFTTADHRGLDEVVASVLEQGLLPSFCTACYRKGRTGDAFMELAKPGDIHHLCRPNAILTLKEYLEDYAPPKVKEMGEKVIGKYLDRIDDHARREATMRRLEKIEAGERDLYF